MASKINGEQKMVPKCGIVMPISPIDGCSAEHWAEVLAILKDVITSINFEPNLVSDADDIGIIQKRIIQNLYDNEVVVCDVSAKNPNVMFELGMRLAFDKPTIIIKDDKTDYTFDTSVIEHLTYPRDLRFSRIIEFKENLKKKIEGTYRKSVDDPKYSTFLKNFGQYKISNLQETEVSSNEFIISSLSEIKSEIRKLKTDSIIESQFRIPTEKEIGKYLDGLITKYATTTGHKSMYDLDPKSNELFNYLAKDPIISAHFTSAALKKRIEDILEPF